MRDVILLTRFLLLIMTVYLSIGGDGLARIRRRRSDGLLVVILFESGVVEFMIGRWIADLLALSSFRRIPHRCAGRKTAVILFLLERRITSTSVLVDEFTTNHILQNQMVHGNQIQSFQWNWPSADVRPTSRMFSYTSVQICYSHENQNFFHSFHKYQPSHHLLFSRTASYIHARTRVRWRAKMNTTRYITHHTFFFLLLGNVKFEIKAIKPV